MFFDVKKLAVTRPLFTTKPPQLHHAFTTTFTTQIAKYPSKTAYFLVTKYLAKFTTVVQIFFLGSLFFVVAALSRRIFIVYLQSVGLFMIYIIGLTVFSATRSMERFWSGIFDPIGLVLSDDVTRYWTVVEKNSLLFSWSGVFLYNRLLWLAVGCIALGTVWALFPMSVEALTARSQGRRAAKAKQIEETETRPERSLVAARLPFVHQVFSASTSWTQFASLSRLRINNILREIPFWAIVGFMIVFAVNNGYFAGRVADVNVWPVTYLMLQAVEGGATLFFYIVAALYAGELIWRERDTHFDGIHDALPMGEATDWLSKLVAIAFVELILLTVAMLCGIVMQTIAGYYHYELLQYFKELYLVTFPQVMMVALLALFIQTVVRNKFIGHAIVIGIFVLAPILYNFGWENTLYFFGNIPPYTYSDMHGYGHFVPALFWSISYWLSICAVLGVISIAYAHRGSDDSWPARTRLALQRTPRLALAAGLLILIAIGSGLWYFYNAHVLNEYLTANQRRGIQADYERQFNGFESIVLYDNKALTATATETPDKKYKVTLNVQARKVKADGNGNESPMALNDYIEIGVFTGKKDEEKPLYLKKEKLTEEKQTFEIVVDQMPTRAGIDPYNKLVDRISDDNMIDVTKQ